MSSQTILKQMAREVLTGYPVRLRTEHPTMTDRDIQRAEGGFDTAVRFIAVVLGGTYHVGYDKKAAEAWRVLCADVRRAITDASHPNRPLEPTDIDDLTSALARLTVAAA